MQSAGGVDCSTVFRPFDRQDQLQNAGSKSSDDPNKYGLIPICAEPDIQTPNTTNVAYAVLDTEENHVSIISDEGDELHVLNRQSVGAVGGRSVWICKLANGGETGKVARLTLRDFPGVDFRNAHFYPCGARSGTERCQGNLEALEWWDDGPVVFGYVIASLTPTQSAVPIFSVQAFRRFFSAFLTTNVLRKEEARVAILTELDALGCPLSDYFVTKKP